MPSVAEIRARSFARDLRACAAADRQRKAENAQRRAAYKASPTLCAVLLEQAKRRGQSAIDWSEYFRNLDIAALEGGECQDLPRKIKIVDSAE